MSPWGKLVGDVTTGNPIRTQRLSLLLFGGIWVWWNYVNFTQLNLAKQIPTPFWTPFVFDGLYTLFASQNSVFVSASLANLCVKDEARFMSFAIADSHPCVAFLLS